MLDRPVLTSVTFGQDASDRASGCRDRDLGSAKATRKPNSIKDEHEERHPDDRPEASARRPEAVGSSQERGPWVGLVLLTRNPAGYVDEDTDESTRHDPGRARSARSVPGCRCDVRRHPSWN